jgi:fructan beta-fructosidase
MTNYTEPYRPQFHFTPETGWMNDPNGMVYYDGKYHLFYQFTPGNIDTFGPKHWGHAVSMDLIHWEHLPVALSPDSLGEIWSGSVVVDWENTSGFRSGDEAVLVAIFTHFKDGLQRQSLAYSNDRGRNWTKYAGNPVIPNPGLADFRDPKVVWHPGTERWVMVLAAGDRVLFYTSPNLIDWKLTSQFGELEGSHGGVWECPDLFPLPVDGNPAKERWVLLVSVGNGAPNGGSGTQYFIGDFNGETFTNHYPATKVNWIDYGKDNYAGVTYSGIHDRRIFMGWMNNWSYAYKVPTRPWRGAMTLPRALELVTNQDGELQLRSLPIPEMQSLRGKHIQIVDENISVAGNRPLIKDVYPFILEIKTEIEPMTCTQVGIRLKTKANGITIIGYDVKAQKFFVDRRRSGLVDFEASFGQHIHATPLELESNSLRLHLFIDTSSIEAFADSGRIVITDLIYPNGQINEAEIYTINGDAHVVNLEAWVLTPIWGK